MLRRTSILWLLAALELASACEKKRPPAPGAPADAAPSTPSSVSTKASAAPSSRPSEERDEVVAKSPRQADAGSAKAGTLADVGPAGPASASRFGVVMITRDDGVTLAALPDKRGAPIATVEQDGGAFAPFARGPAVAGEHAYWISKGRLVRRKIKPSGPLEVLSPGARDGTRVSAAAASAGRPGAAAYIAGPNKPDGDPVAMLWIEGQDAQRVSPEGAAASSVALTSTSEELFVAYIEGRSGMSPVHARRVKFSDGKPVLEDDVVVWVGGTSQPLTEIVSGKTTGGDLWAFVPIERDSSRFGLAELRIGDRPKMGTPVTWRGFPNGLDPAPLALSEACGTTMLAYAQPSEAKPGAPQELHLTRVEREGLSAPEVLARARAFSNISLAAAGDGLLVAYVADHRTWSVAVDCPKN